MKRAFLGLGAFAIFLAIGIGSHLYVIRRLVVDAGVPAPAALVLEALVWASYASIIAQPLLARRLPRVPSRLLGFWAVNWMALLFWLLVALGASDLVLLLSGALGDPRVAELRAVVVVLGVLAVALVARREALRAPRDLRVEVELARWPQALDGYRIVQLSDVHIGASLGRDFARALTQRVEALRADLVVVTGDLVDGRREHLEAEVAPFAGLRGRDGVFFVPGNHDFYSGVADWCECVGMLGIRVLRNEHVVIERGDLSFVLAGVDDHRSGSFSGSGGEDLERALADRSPGLATLLLAHDPSTFTRAQSMQVDLQLSGHTHGGQIWPFHYLVRLAVPFLAGLYRRGAAQLYVSRGTGYWGPAMRLGAPAELTEIVLRAPAAR